MTKELWQRAAIRLGGRNGGEELAAVADCREPKATTALLPSVRATREDAP